MVFIQKADPIRIAKRKTVATVVNTVIIVAIVVVVLADVDVAEPVISNGLNELNAC